ncbi:hypothetical protein [Mahella australiensis]|uniref:Uncharacterized protein n=1 Tax=Mahella australiensis (strain DSM 15567 / CIP 107919 / 50-1 BON) TaxID=697281 RepID=F3ZWV0_MAHA5|nr:hypothetical protein [Mahella australiensis]AEE97572.1 hypothetical protein Mahau_2409 [Mahella australiensis 50-1 BON]
MKKIYIDTRIQAIDEPLKEEFADRITIDREKADILVLSKKSTEPGEIARLITPAENRRIMFLADNKDTELIAEAKAAGIRDIFYSPVKLPLLSERITEALAQAEPDTAEPNNAKLPAAQPTAAADKPKTDNPADKTDELNAILQTIKKRMANGNQTEVLRKENQELKAEIKKYEDFISVLKEIFIQEV